MYLLTNKLASSVNIDCLFTEGGLYQYKIILTDGFISFRILMLNYSFCGVIIG